MNQTQLWLGGWLVSLGFIVGCQAPEPSASPYIRPLADIQQAAQIKTSSSAINTALKNSAFYQWARSKNVRQQQLSEYADYLQRRTGVIPPLDQLTLSARSYERCGRDQYSLAPKELWNEMIPTLNLYKTLKAKGVLPPSSEIISVYRDAELNRCAGGAGASKHVINNALDISLNQTGYDHAVSLNELCEFWRTQGDKYRFGLGIYRSGSIHIDTSGYRHWGSNYSSSTSTC